MKKAFEEAITTEPTQEDWVPPVEIVSERSPLDIVNPQEGFDYLWASKDANHPQFWGKMQNYGWRLVSKVGGNEVNHYGRQEYNDLVLMRRPMWVSEELRKVRKENIDRMIRSAERKMTDIQEQANRAVGEDDALTFLSPVQRGG